MKRSWFVPFFVIAAMVIGCETAPKNEEKKDELHDAVLKAMADMKAEDPGFDAFISKAHGYVVFPNVGKGGFIVGGAWGRGEVYEKGKLYGYAEMTQATVGAQVGGQKFAEVLVFENKDALDRFINQKYEATAQASAVALKSGEAANAKFTDGVAIFTYVKGGLMAEAALGGQKFTFVPVR